MDARDAAELWAAERQGLIPDPWLQSTQIIASLINLQKSGGRALQPEEFLYRVAPSKAQSAEEMQAGFRMRKGMADGGSR